MRFLHTSDLHIGKTVCGFSMLEEQRHVLEQMVQMVSARQIDAVFLSGDLYDRALPPSQAVTVLDEFLTRLVSAGVMVCAVAGNHDSGERIGFANRILEQQELYLEGTPRKQVAYADWNRDGEMVRVHMLPFARPAQIRDLYQTPVQTYEEGVRESLKHVAYLKGGRNLLLTHHFVVNQGKAPELSDSETRVSVGGVDQVEAAHFKKFDYVALGHIHRPQQIGDGPIYYSGSPVKYSFSEASHEKSVLLGEWDGGGRLQLERIPLTPIHDMRKIRGTLSDLMVPAVVSLADEQDYLLAVLTNREDLADPIGTLRSVYPNVMQLMWERELEEEGQDAIPLQRWKEKSPYQLFEQFYEWVMEETLDPEQETVLREVIAQAGEESL